MSVPRLRAAIRIDHDGWQSAMDDTTETCRQAVLSAWRLGRKALDSSHPLASPLTAPVEVSVLLSSDRVVHDLNRDHLGRDKPTNVLSFPGQLEESGSGADILLGDVILAWETVRAEAEETGKAVRNHMSHLVVHGVLHLLGYDHESDADAEIMERLEVDSLAHLGMPDPYAHSH